MRQLRISEVGLRGVVGTGLTAQHVIDFATAFATYLRTPGPVVVGRDPRASSEMLRQGVLSGLMACGRDVIDLGLVSTPVLQHAIQRFDAAGGVSIGASHNTAEWNALKFFGREGSYLATAEANELLDIYHLRRFSYADWPEIGKLRLNNDAVDWYLDQLATVFDFGAIRQYRVVADCCNGTSALILQRMIDRFQLPLILINAQMRGVSFAHDPATTRETAGLQLAPLMKPLNADAGFLFDVDSDRIAVATEQGIAISEELVLPLLSDYLLPKAAGKVIVTNLSTTALLEWIAAKHGGRVARVPVGRQAAADAIATYRPGEIALAGEGTGAVMMPQFRFVYDGIASMLGILSFMAESGKNLSRILSEYPEYSIVKGQIPLVTKRIPRLLMDLREQYSNGVANTSDGLRVDWEDRWFHVRVSQTEPIVRVICEQRGTAPTELYNALVDQIQGFA